MEYVIIAILCGLLCRHLAKLKGRNLVYGFISGFLFNLFAVAYYLFAPSLTNQTDGKRFSYPAWIWLAVSLIVLALIGITRDSSNNTEATKQLPVQSTAPASPAPLSVAFNAPTVLGKTLDEVTAILGTPEPGGFDPTELQISMGVTRDRKWLKDGISLQAEFDPTNGKMVTTTDGAPFISQEPLSDGLTQSQIYDLMIKTNTVKDSTAYTVEQVSINREPGKFTGFKLVKN